MDFIRSSTRYFSPLQSLLLQRISRRVSLLLLTFATPENKKAAQNGIFWAAWIWQSE